MAKFLYIDTDKGKIQVPVEKVVEKLQPGDILLEGRRGIANIISFLIQTIIRCRYAHAAIYWDKSLIIEAKFPDVQVSKLSCYAGKNCHLKFFRVKNMTPELSQKVIDYALDKIDAGYDKWLIILYLWRIILGTLGKAPMPDDHSKYVCSELVADCYHANGIPLGGEYPDNVTSKDILLSPFVEEIQIVEN